MRKQVGRLAAAVVVVSAVISGCGGGPSQAGAAVIVGSEAVPIETVQGQIETAMSKPDQVAQLTAQGGGPPDIARSIVTREVIHELLTRRAAEEGIVVTDAQIEAELSENGGADAVLGSSLYNLSTLRQRVRDDLIASALGQWAVGGLAVTADLVAATSRAEADEIAKLLAAGGPAADALFTDQQRSAKGNAYQAAAQPDAAGTVLFGVPVGTVVSFQPDPQQSNWIVLKVTDRRTDAPSDPTAVSSISRSQLIAVGERSLQSTGEELGIRVNPRYGVWDPIQLRVVDADQQAGTILTPTAAAG